MKTPDRGGFRSGVLEGRTRLGALKVRPYRVNVTPRVSTYESPGSFVDPTPRSAGPRRAVEPDHPITTRVIIH